MQILPLMILRNSTQLSTFDFQTTIRPTALLKDRSANKQWTRGAEMISGVGTAVAAKMN